jgi:hypothetical protein
MERNKRESVTVRQVLDLIDCDVDVDVDEDYNLEGDGGDNNDTEHDTENDTENDSDELLAALVRPANRRRREYQ